MASLLPNLSCPTLILHSKHKTIIQQTFLSHPTRPIVSLSALPKLEPPPPVGITQFPSTSQDQNQQQQRNNFYLNLGLAVRTLREDLPLLFTEDLNYDIYRDDITFMDPLNTFSGIDKYKLIFWALRFHGRILFREIGIDVIRVWQPSENVILIRWNLRGTPRVPWEAMGQFQGTSRYKLDRDGKIYEHKVDNLAFNFPQRLKPAASVLDLVTACPASPNPTFLWRPVDLNSYSTSWVEFYIAVKETLDCENHSTVHDHLVTCS
ncbi:uncharacterized protein LOC130752138 [Actinidia eriantha]|uniref:uncharacterized protein LOC130752138 n=1 Tax=Actinidia eriantha TaxID=165200 RepID=UPI002584B575|nr:uncharacterized protein LOC130752138 [Actinidia eriantha]